MLKAFKECRGIQEGIVLSPTRIDNKERLSHPCPCSKAKIEHTIAHPFKMMVIKNFQNVHKNVLDQFWWLLYVTSKLTSLCVNLLVSSFFFVNLLPSPAVWLFVIWHLSDNLTYFWHFISFWHFDILTHDLLSKPSQPVTGLFSWKVMIIYRKAIKMITTYKL